jgi:2-methylfumaryl-CoA hydratase
MNHKINKGNFFEDFTLGQEIIHPLPRTISDGDVSLYIALTGSRFALHASEPFAKQMGYDKKPIDDILGFHLSFGKSVQDISLNAIANLGYAEVSFKNPLFVGDTVSLSSSVIGLKENSNGKSGVVYVHSIGHNQHGEEILNLKRWVMVHKKDPSTHSGINVVPKFAQTTPISEEITIPRHAKLDMKMSGGAYLFEDYDVGERLDHPEGMTIDESDHTMATKLYQNNAKVHFDAHMMQGTPMGKRLMYGGHVISIARTLSFNGLQNAMRVYAINAGVHANPTFGGDTLYAYTEVLEKMELPRHDIGLLRLRTVGVKNQRSSEITQPKDEEGKYLPNVVLDLDYTVVIPRKSNT